MIQYSLHCEKDIKKVHCKVETKPLDHGRDLGDLIYNQIGWSFKVCVPIDESPEMRQKRDAAKEQAQKDKDTQDKVLRKLKQTVSETDKQLARVVKRHNKLVEKKLQGIVDGQDGVRLKVDNGKIVKDDGKVTVQSETQSMKKNSSFWGG